VNNEFNLANEIITLSIADTWDAALMEWDLDYIYRVDTAETCLCGHYPILELCVLVNEKNNNHATVGNVCVKKFFGINCDAVFSNIKKIKSDISKAANVETIDYACDRKWISEWETNFYLDTWRKRVLSSKQAAIRTRINATIIKRFDHASRLADR